MHRFSEAPHPFAFETATLHYAEDRPCVAQHLKLQLTLDFEAEAISGVATHVLKTLRRAESVTFDAVDLNVSRVEVDGKSVAFDASSSQKLHVRLRRPAKAGTVLEVRITYRARPARGLYFIGPDKEFPNRPRQAWTQGQDIESRNWFPCFDAPAQKCPSEMRVTFPSTMTALSNGRLVSDSVKGQLRTMHYRLDAPHAPYLVTLVVGALEQIEQRCGPTVIRSLFEPGRRADAQRTVRRTPEMMALFERWTGRPYPWGDYAQVFVSEFIFGGMENTGATTLTDVALVDERAQKESYSETLIAHELAHQWFGDLLTCREWPHGWLNEGFATYAEILWREEAHGKDEADHQRRVDLDAYLVEVSERYARPIVARSFDLPIDLFDRHLYEKGGLVVHELRRRLGDDDFNAVIRYYVKTHQGSTVETVDLARSVEHVTGRNLDRFFDDYVERAGHPELKIVAAYDAQRRCVRVEVKQTQSSAAYELSLPMQLVEKGVSKTHELAINEKEHVFEFAAAREPSMCIFDLRRDLLATLEVDKPLGWWREELAHAPMARAQTEAAQALEKDPSVLTVEALGSVLATESAFWGTRAACAKSLGNLRTPGAKRQLLASLAVRHPKVRRGVVAALGEFFQDVEVGEALRRLCVKGDASVFVEGEAARSLGKVRGPDAFEVLGNMLKRSSFQEAIRIGALDGLAHLQDARAWELVKNEARYGAPALSRGAAIAALAKLAEEANKKTQTVEVLGHFLRDSQFRARWAAIQAAKALGDERLIGQLTSTPFPDGRELRMAREVVRSLRGKAPHKELKCLREELEKLRAEVRTLKERAEPTPRGKR